MSDAQPKAREFRSRILNRQHVLGTFIKFPPPHSVEIVAHVGFDFVIIDQEHAPFDRAAIDVACLAARATNIAAIVRVPEVNAACIMVARAANMPTIALVSSRADARAMHDLGVRAFVHSNDQNLLKTAAAQASKDYADPTAW